jgi:hypothetical protein
VTRPEGEATPEDEPSGSTADPGTTVPAADDPGSTEEPADADAGTEPEWVRRRRLDAVFGDGAHGQALGDRWYRDQVPPHHG